MPRHIGVGDAATQAIIVDECERGSRGVLSISAESTHRGRRVAASLCLTCCLVASMSHANAESRGNKTENDTLKRQSRLSTVQIASFFSDVIDRGDVQDQPEIEAETRWYADGRFVSRWWYRASGDGDSENQRVAGRWKAQDNLRCVTFNPGSSADWSCAEVWLLDDGRILSLNPDGSPHGVHRISPLK